MINTLESHLELDWLKKWNQYSPENIAVEDGDTGEFYTYGACFELSKKMAAHLYQEFGIRNGDRVALLAQNEMDTFILFFALARIGATLVPINHRLAAPEVEHILNDSQSSLALVQSDLKHLVSHRKDRVFLFEDFRKKSRSVESSFENFDSHPDTAALLIYTSGTTGFPKGALLSHKMLFWNSINTTLRLNITQSDSAVIFLPLFHTGGWNVFSTPFFHRGAKIILMKKFEASKVLSLTSQKGCGLLFGVPTTMEMMARTPEFQTIDLKSVRYAIVGGEPMALEAIQVWTKKGVPVRQGYGLTEFGPNVFSLNEQDAVRKMGSIGFPNFYVQAKIIDDHGNEVGPEQIGELCLRGPMMMTGYWRNQKATEDTIQNGWLKTGDLVRKDSEGFYYVVGRKKEMFISGGENVYPAEIEKVIRQIPSVKEVAVIGVKDEKWGEVGKAFVVAEPSLNEKLILEHCLLNLAKFKVPKSFAFMKELPKGDSGKILKKALH